jgi:N-methylhydantoinase A/oxoprolinase/acetone carboxylase beta subunit
VRATRRGPPTPFPLAVQPANRAQRRPASVRRGPFSVLDLASLPLDRSVSGPAIIEDFSGTTLVPPGWRVRRERFGLRLVRTRRPQISD